MIELTRWNERTWTFDLPIGAFPAVLERIRGTPTRAADLVMGHPEDLLAWSPEGAWSAKRHLGHLGDLHQLDMRRLEEFLRGAPVLSGADMKNHRTSVADHDRRPAAEIASRLRQQREVLIQRLEALREHEVGTQSLHPRLRRSMRLVDWAQLLADHVDHHLARARQHISLARIRTQ